MLKTQKATEKHKVKIKGTPQIKLLHIDNPERSPWMVSSPRDDSVLHMRACSCKIKFKDNICI